MTVPRKRPAGAVAERWRGEMLNIHDLKAAYEKAIGHATSDSTVYNLLHRHDWRKLMPRPSSQARPRGTDCLKKPLPDAVRKARRAAARRGRRLRIMFADEARFGRMNRIRPCWAPLGTRPAVAAQLIRQYIYLYGAVSPKDGTCVYLIMPTSNTASSRPSSKCWHAGSPGKISCLFSTARPTIAVAPLSFHAI